jgi:signal transduction histidine kinase
VDSAHVAPQGFVSRRVDRSRRGGERRRVPDAAEIAVLSAAALVRGIHAAANCTCRGIALTSKRSLNDVQRQLAPAVRWLISRVESEMGSEQPTPIVAQEYVDRLRSHLVRELSACEVLDGRDVVRVLGLLEQLSDAWKQTDRGKFMARLTGSESASAVVAIAHDIRSPLSSILILVESLRRGRGAINNPIQERQLGLIYGATQGLTTLASDLIDAARGEELVEDDARPFSLVEIMHSVGAIVQPIAEEKGLQLNLTNPETDARIGHAAALHRVLLNLTSNALRYTDTGSVTLGCREREKDNVEFWVQDTGRGLPRKVQETLFDAFRPEQVALRFSSAGLGLATVRALLAAMSSDLRVDTSPERGTRLSFELYLPPSPR